MINQAILDIVSKDFTYSVFGGCNGCQLCEYLATDNFAQEPGQKRFFVAKQPVTWEEKEQCFEAMERCPLHGISRTEKTLA